LRNATVWKKSWKTSLVGSVGEPLFYLLGLGYGLGALMPAMDGRPYLDFVVPGLMLSSVMYSTTIESTYNTFMKMEHQQLFASMLLSPLTFDEIVLGEVSWAVTKGLLSGGTLLVLSLALGVGEVWPGVLAIGLLLVTGVIFASMGLVITSLAKGYDFFNYYFTLAITPMFFFSGIFFPVATLGRWVEYVAWFFPLTHLVRLSRALMHGTVTTDLWQDAAWVTVFGALALWFALTRMSRRFRL
jgi:lipooligosaccharide transport system permease protein